MCQRLRAADRRADHRRVRHEARRSTGSCCSNSAPTTTSSSRSASASWSPGSAPSHAGPPPRTRQRRRPASSLSGRSASTGAARLVEFDGHPVDLTPKEYDLLVFLASDAGAVRSREQLIHDVWDEHWWGSTKTLDVHVASLRKKLRRGADRDRAIGRVPTRRAAGGQPMTRRLIVSYLAITVVVLVLLEVPFADLLRPTRAGTVDIGGRARRRGHRHDLRRRPRGRPHPRPATSELYEDAHRRTGRGGRCTGNLADRHRAADAPRLLDPTRDRNSPHR